MAGQTSVRGHFAFTEILGDTHRSQRKNLVGFFFPCIFIVCRLGDMSLQSLSAIFVAVPKPFESWSS